MLNVSNSFTETLSISCSLCFLEAARQHSVLEERFLDGSPSIDSSTVSLSKLKIIGAASGLSLSF